MRTGRCPSQLGLSRAFSEGISEELRQHLDTCGSCATEWASIERLRQLGQALPAQVPDVARRDAVLARILYEAERLRQAPPSRPPTRRWSFAVAAAAVGFAALIALGLRSLGHERTSFRVRITAREGARFAQQGSARDEVVRLFDGSLQLDVAHLRPGERFRVQLGDAEVEVKGTAFSVAAVDDQLRSVVVQHGIVEVRPRSAPPVRLGAGQTWQAAAASADGVPKVVPAKAAEPAAPAEQGADRAAVPLPRDPKSAAAAPPTAGSRTAAERAFATGFAALKQGRFLDAAPELERAVALAPTGQLAEDARFWSGVAWARAGRSREAIKRLSHFLALHPQSPRTGEARVALGWLLLKANRLDEAERTFSLASRHAEQAVQKSAQAGLSAVSAARRNPTP